MTPLANCREGVLEVAAGARQAVLHAGGPGCPDAAIDQPRGLELTKPAAAQAVRHAGHRVDDGGEAHRS